MKSVSYFPTFERKFYFSNSINGKLLLKQFYQPYSFLTSTFCLLWYRLPFLTKIFTTTIDNLPLHINTMQSILGWENIDFVLSGGAGFEKKITGFCINIDTRQKVFFKYGSTACAIELVKNEIKVLSSLSLPFAPKLLYNGIELNKNSWFVTETFDGVKYNKKKVSEAILDLLLSINKEVYSLGENVDRELVYMFSHGDFCPWNLVINKKNIIKVIDWEMAGIYPLGYDLFTFVFQTSFLLSPNKKSAILIKENTKWFIQYFNHHGVNDYLPYLKEFTQIKLKREQFKKNYVLLENYQNLNKTLDTL